MRSAPTVRIPPFIPAAALFILNLFLSRNI